MSVHHVDPKSKRVIRWCGGAITCIAAICFLAITGAPGAAVLLSIFGSIALVAAALCFNSGCFLERRTVTLTHDGIAVGSGDVVPWSELVAFRERPLLQRLDLLDASGKKRASVAYAIEDAAIVVACVLGHLLHPTETSARRLGKRRPIVMGTVTIVFILTMTAGIVLSVFKGNWFALFGLLIVYAVFAAQFLNPTRELEITDDAIIVRGFFGEVRAPLANVAKVDLVLSETPRGRFLTTTVQLIDGQVGLVNIRNVAAERVFEAITSRFPDRAAAPPHTLPPPPAPLTNFQSTNPS
ncbi:MAG TPA: hypothetical protein VMU84_04905 [Thermoanaerobaculia bacterium]|nr:hypothetical protein [Thermoanaerobaculia bacterium]